MERVRCTLRWKVRASLPEQLEQVRSCGGTPDFNIIRFAAIFPSMTHLAKFRSQYPQVEISNVTKDNRGKHV